jgi:hypothetical protein
MAELFANNASSTLSAAITDTDDEIPLHDGSRFPAIGEAAGYCRILIDSEIIRCWNHAATNTLMGSERGFEGTIAAAHAENAVVTQIVTAEAAEDFSRNGLMMVTGIGDFWTRGFNPNQAADLRDSFTWVNQGAATFGGDVRSFYTLVAPYNGDNDDSHLRMVVQNISYVATRRVALAALNIMPLCWYNDGGVCFRESATGKVVTFGTYGGVITVDYWTDENTWSATSALYRPIVGSIADRPVQLHMGRGAAGSDALSFGIMRATSGWSNCWSSALDAFFTTAPDQWGIFANSAAQWDSMIVVLYRWLAGDA